MRQVPRNKRYLGSNFCSGLVTTWKVSTDRKIFKSFQESFQNFPLSSSEGLEEMNKQVKISSQLSMNFFHQVTWGRSRTRKKLIAGKVLSNNKSLMAN